MVDNSSTERRVIFRPYSQSGQRANVYVCISCGKHFPPSSDMAELATVFAEHLCEPFYIESDERSLGALKH